MKRMIKNVSIFAVLAIILTTYVPVGAGAFSNNDSYNTKNTIIYTNETKPSVYDTGIQEVDIDEGEGNNPTTSPISTQTPTTQPETVTPTSEPVTTEPATTEPIPTEPQTTTITLKEKNHTIFIRDTVAIKATVKNGIGSTSYTSENENIATVDQKGVVTAKNKIGKTKIFVENNGVKEVFTVKVKYPYLAQKGKEVKTVTVHRNCTTAVRIRGKVKGIDNEYKTSKGVSVMSENDDKIIYIRGNNITKNSNKATVKVNVSGRQLKLKVKVVATTPYQKLAKVTYIHKKPKIKRIYNSVVKVSELYDVEHNFDKLLAQKKITKNQYKAFIKALNPKTYAVSGKGLVLNKAKKTFTVHGKDKAKTNVAFRFKDGTKYRTVVTTDKPATKKVRIVGCHVDKDFPILSEYYLTDKKATAKVAYSAEEAYQALKEQFFTYIIKGEWPKYEYIYAAYNEKDDVLEKVINKHFEDDDNFYNFLRDFGGGDEIHLPYGYVDINKCFEIFYWDPYTEKTTKITKKQEYKPMLASAKRVYNAAQKILKECRIEEGNTTFDNKLDKFIYLANWISDHYTYGIADCNGANFVERFVCYRTGNCTDASYGFAYLCSLIGVPCHTKGGKGHVYCIVKLNNKWYCHEPQGHTQGSLWGKDDDRYTNPNSMYYPQRFGDHGMQNKKADMVADKGLNITAEHYYEVIEKF